MNSTRALLATTDSQLKFCPPNVWPAFITTFVQHSSRIAFTIPRPGIAVVVKDANGFGQCFPVCVLYSSIEGEPYSFECAFSLC